MPQPGLALLRLAQDDIDTAAAGIRRALTETQGKLERLGLAQKLASPSCWPPEISVLRARGR